MMTKVAYNGCFGGFSLTDEAVRFGRKISGDDKWGGFTIYGEMFNNGSGPCSLADANYLHDLSRTDKTLIEVIETLGKKACGQCSSLCIAEIPDGTKYRIDEYDGNETVETPDSYEWETA
jgi:hypothetical protein